MNYNFNKENLSAALGQGISITDEFMTFCNLCCISVTNSSHVSFDTLCKLMHESYSCMHKITEEKFIISVTANKSSENHDTSNILAVCVDVSFLFDSMQSIITSENHIIYQSVHCAIQHPLNPEIKLFIISFFINSISDIRAQNLQKILINSLDAVYVYDQDEKNILNKINETKSLLAEQAPDKSLDEIVDFLTWLSQNNFILLGCGTYFPSTDGNVSSSSEEPLGLLKLYDNLAQYVIKNDYQSSFYITESDKISPVFKCTNIDIIGIRLFDSSGKLEKEIRFFGLFSHLVYIQDVNDIPIIRKKIQRIRDRFKYVRNRYYEITLSRMLQNFSRFELLHLDENILVENCEAIISLSTNPQMKLILYEDTIGGFTRCILFIPRKQYSYNKGLAINNILCQAFSGKLSNQKMHDYYNLVRLQITIKVFPPVQKVDIDKLKRQLAYVALEWEENLHDALIERLPLEQAETLFAYYSKIFSARYQKSFTVNEAYHDIVRLEQVKTTGSISVALYNNTHNEDAWNIKVYLPYKNVDISDMLPIIDNMCMKTSEHHTYTLHHTDSNFSVWVHYFTLSIDRKTHYPVSAIKEQFEETLVSVLEGRSKNDAFNNFILLSGITIREVTLLRALSAYLDQIMFRYNGDILLEALRHYPETVSSLIDLFNAKFKPGIIDNRQQAIDIATKKIKDRISTISELCHDQAIKGLLILISSISRTNYYQSKPFIALKISPHDFLIQDMVMVFAEIFVYSQEFEGIHIRGASVSRGGLRYSDKSNDLRVEILGLMKTQMSKNTVIVPSGAKGGFTVKSIDKSPKNVRKCYKNFLIAMLSITDNIILGQVRTPPLVVKYDKFDPYLVIAADKGTASFSDLANEVSAEYKFWLGDAFASGGSSGYDHKAMGITARGAWIALEHHFIEIGQDIYNNNFTVLGIGDMSGDVFGNGMLCSTNIQLIAAFNHIHIFIDPYPNAKISFVERKRLFDLPHSTWMDYDPACLSEGGAIFPLTMKSIPISPQIASRFNITQSELSPHELIRHILLANVDVIWNGGIGIFFKSEIENNDTLWDRCNDQIRVNAKDLQTQVLVEGGNRGCTQLGRIEFASKGGRINTDFLDNSGGVICSDIEVNIKIVLERAIHKKKITMCKRNKTLISMKTEVTNMVLYRFVKVLVKSLSIAHLQSKSQERTEQYQRLIKKLEKSGLLHRKEASLPNDEEISQMLIDMKHFERPQIAMLIAYTKMYLYAKVLQSDLPDNIYFNKYLIEYFPKEIKQNYKEEILTHPLRREIIANYITNTTVNRMGCTFVHSMLENTGTLETDILIVYVVLRDAYDIRSIWAELDALDGKVFSTNCIEMISEIHEFINTTTSWVIKNYTKSINIALLVAEFSSNIQKIYNNIETVLDKKKASEFNARLEEFQKMEISPKLARFMSALPFLSSCLPIIHIAHTIKSSEAAHVDILVVAKIYFKIGDFLHLDWLQSIANKIEKNASYWQRIAVRLLKHDISDKQIEVTAKNIQYLTNVHNDEHAINSWIKNNQKNIDTYNYLLNDLKSYDDFDICRLFIIIKRLTMVI